MKLLIEFVRANPWSSIGVLACLLVAIAAEGLGYSSLFPLLSLATGDAPGAGSSRLEQGVLAVLGAVGLEPKVPTLLGLLTTSFFVKAGLVFVARRQLGYAVARFVTDARLRLLRALFRTHWSFYVNQPVGRLANTFVIEAHRAGRAYLNAAWMVAYAIQLALYVALALVAAWQVTLGAIIVGAIAVATLGRLVRGARTAGRKQTRLFQSLVAGLTDLLQGVKPLKAMGRERQLVGWLERDTLRLEQALRREVLSKESLWAIQEPLVIALLSGFFVVGWSFRVSISTLVLLSVVLARGYLVGGRAQRQYQNMAVDESACNALRDAIEAAESQAETGRGGAPPSLDQAVELQHVRAAHAGQVVFEDVDLRIPAGEITALIGPSGAGKTTLVDLVVGLHAPESGEVRVDGRPLAELDQAAWRSSIGYVPQDTMLLHDSIERNITLGDPELRRDDVERALREAHVWDFVERLPDGVDTVVGERGSRLSGGQRQRVAIARALVHRPCLLILDEATTALDPESEAAIWSAVRELRGRTTVLAISHQPALLEVADRVYRIEDGKAALSDRSPDRSPASAA